MNRLLNSLLTLLLLFFLTVSSALAQDSEAEMKASADKLFDAESYIEATSLYLKLIALNPRSPEYNYKYGTCLLFNSYKKQDAFKYLNFAVSDPNIDVQAYYFLGKAHHLTYQFNEAIKNYELYKQKAGSKINPAFDVQRQIEMCQNGKRLLTTITDLVVLEKKEIDVQSFFRLYDLRNIGGDIIVAANFQSKTDKKKNHVPLIHFPANSPAVYYASYGESDGGQKDIYTRKKLPDGSWSLPQKINGNVNTNFDEDFPYMSPNGEYLYFCSKGHNSMGGYDIFRSRYDTETNTFGVPENMDFAICSPDNDLFYVVDSLDQNAYFASSRQSANGKMFVYKVRVERLPLQLAVIKGDFSSQINPTNKKITITVTDFASGEKIGAFVSTDKGKYLITFPKGGKYTYQMKVEGSEQTHQYLVNIPFLKEFKPLKQRISHESLENAEVVKVTDLFNEEVEDPQSVLAEVIKMRSELNVNVQQFNLDELNASKENQKILAELGLATASPQEIVSKFENIAEKQEQIVEANESLVNGALSNAMENLNRAEKLQNEAKNLVAKTSAEEDPKAKYALLKEAQTKMNAADELKTEVAEYLLFADSVAKAIPAEKEKSNQVRQVSDAVKKAVEENQMAAVKEAVTPAAALLKEVAEKSGTNPMDPLLAEKSKLVEQKKKLDEQVASYRTSETSLTKEIDGLNKQLEAAKTKEKPEIQSAIDRKVSEKDLVAAEKQGIEKQIEKVLTQAKAVDEKIDFVQNVTQTTDAKTIAPNEVQARLSEVDTKNNRTLDAYIDQQVAEWSKNTTVASSDPQNGNASETHENGRAEEISMDAVRELVAEVEADQKAIDAAPGLTEKAKLQAKNANDKKVLEQVAQKQKEVAAVLETKPTDIQAKELLKELQAIQTDTESKIAERKKALDELMKAELATAPPTPENELATIFPQYKEEKIKARQSDPENQLQSLNEVDKQLLAKVVQEQQQVDNALAQDPENTRLNERKVALTELKKRTEENIASRDAAIAQIKGGNAGNETVENGSNETVPNNNTEQNGTNTSNPPTENATPEKELARLMPNYEARKQAVSDANPVKRLEENIQIDQQLVDIIEDALQDINTELKSDPANASLKDKQVVLSELKSEKEAAIVQTTTVLEAVRKEAQIAEIAATVPQEKEVLVPGYEDKIRAAKSDDRATELKQLNSIDQELLTQTREALTEVEQQLSETPDNAALNTRKDVLKRIEQETLNSMEKRNQELLASGTPKDPLAEAKQTVRPKYEQNLAKIEASTALSADQKALARLNEEAAVLEALNGEVAKKEEALVKNPADETLKKNIESLKEAQAIQETLVTEQKEDLIALEKAKIKPQVLQSEIFPEYVAPDLEQRSTWTDTQVKDLLEQEQQLQDKLTKTIRANEKKLAAKFDPTLAAENKVLNELLEASSDRKQQLNQPVQQSFSAEASVLADLGEKGSEWMTTTIQSKEQGAELLKCLQTYEAELAKQEVQLDRKPDASAEEKQQLADKRLLVQKRIASIESTIDQLNQLVEQGTNQGANEVAVHSVENSSDTSVSSEQQELAVLKNEQFALEEQIRNGTPAEKKIASKALKVNTAKQSELSERLAQQALAAVQETRENEEKELQQTTGNTALTSAVLKRSTELTQPIESKEETATAQAVQKETQAASLLAATNSFIHISTVQKENGIIAASPEQLEASKRRFIIEIGQIDAERATLGTTAQDQLRQQTLEAQKNELETAINQLIGFQNELAAEKVENDVLKTALNTQVTYEEEMNLAADPAYPAALQRQYEVKAAVAQVNQLHSEMNQKRYEIDSETDPEARRQKIAELTALNGEWKSAKEELVQREQALEQAISALPGNSDVWKNLLAREVAPIKNTSVTSVVAPIVADGFEIKTPDQATGRIQKIIPLGLKAPSGLVYRVQVGAFAKPIPEELFKEFTPVTGEKLDNGITRYLAGYFSNRNTVVDAQKQIRALGYTDAFVVAYCDGTRISLAEARRLEDLGLCVPKNHDSLVMEVVQNTIAQLPQDSIAKFKPEVKPSDYNKAPGAAIAQAAEEKKGLFFTVQVGVYNRPVPAEQVRNIEPLITKRLENGQIRYSSGVFRSIADARPKRTEAITRGITDAFITAYYNGERIPIDEAKRLLADKGDSILIQEEVTVVGQDVTEAVQFATEHPLKNTPTQLVSEQAFRSYPGATIERLNNFGSFYYDSIDLKVKSMYYASASLPDVSALGVAFDTLAISSSVWGDEPKGETVVATWADSELSGAFANWLLRSNLPYEAQQTDQQLLMRFTGVGSDQAVYLKQQLEKFGADRISSPEQEEKE